MVPQPGVPHPSYRFWEGGKIGRYLVVAMLFAGGFAGLAGAVEVTGVHHRAIEALEQRGSTPEGQQLAAFLEARVRDRVGDTPSVQRVGPGALRVQGTSGNRYAEVGPGELVDHALALLGVTVESLWT